MLLRMDCSQPFHSIFSGVAFKNKNDFYNALRDFELVIHVIFFTISI